MSINHASLEPAEDPTILVVTHLPERRRRRSAPAQAGPGCTCCCCCCLHTVGGIIGAAVGPALGRGPQPRSRSYLPLTHYWEEEDDEFDSRYWARARKTRSSLSAVKVFWHTLLVLVGIFFLVTLCFMSSGGRIHLGSRILSGFLFGAFILLLVFPAVQIGAALIAALILALSPYPDKGFQLWQLLKIFLGIVVGTGLGILIMAGFFFLLTGR